MARLAMYGAISTILAGSVIASALAQRSNFYAASIYLYKSNACMMIILNMGLFLTIVAGQLVQAIFFGNLRTLEVEHLYERAWYAITETCLAMTIFKDDFDTRFVVMFTILLFLKVFHWLCQDRVDSMEQSPEIPLSFHVRMVTMITMLVSLDILMILHAVEMFSAKGPNMMIMFAFEIHIYHINQQYTLLATSLMASFGKYVLHTIDMRREEPWENKSMLLFYLDLVADFIKLITYIMFFLVILFNYGLPLHIIRDVYMTMRSFVQKCKDLIQYRKATRNMNERYPDASAAELAALSDPICIICREEMVGQHGPSAAGAATGSSKHTDSTPRIEHQSPTPVPAGADGAAAAGPAQAGGAPGVNPGAGAPGQHGAGVQGFGNINHPNGQAPLGHHLPQNGPNPGFPIPLLAPQGHYPLGAWNPHLMAGGYPGGLPQNDVAGNPTQQNRDGTAGGFMAPSGTGAGASASSADSGSSSTSPSVSLPVPGVSNGFVPTFSIPNVTHPIPGLIPLYPIAGGVPLEGSSLPGASSSPLGPQHGASLSYLNGLSGGFRATEPLAPSDRQNSHQTRLTALDALSDEQLQSIEQNTRQGLEERLNLLNAVNGQIQQSISVLSQALLALPPPGTAIRSEAADPPSPVFNTSSIDGSENTQSGVTEMFKGKFSIGSGVHRVSSSSSSSSSHSIQGHHSVGLQSYSRSLNSSAPASEAVLENNQSTEASPPSTSTTLSATALPAPIPKSTEKPDEAAILTTATALEGDERQESRAVDKGKGKKSEGSGLEEIPSYSSVQVQEVVVEHDTEGDSEEEDANYSPQEMVRRRWAKVDVALSE
ncbi:E3 ubiquitin-protein ligase hrd1 [Lunasporangiospora selenospora]|uniref:E3 ubiquitin-protein ligase hrd1 n=1 Tax=Lunasporangiospora selenospora TaxID=979761 RepID=A0A9P6FSH6_9FUNG|nr:E3 ubiquitin-protein ligase hrd1 [Lunasporangiospora selenospora]